MRKPQPSERPFLFVLPALGLMVAVALYPLASTVWLSFYDELPIFGISHFVGLSHYVELWRDPRFWHSLSNTLYFTVISVTLEVILGLGAALLLQQVFPARGLVRALVLMPWFIPTVVAARLWEWIYNPQLGVLNFLLRESGLSADGLNWQQWCEHAARLAGIGAGNGLHTTVYTQHNRLGSNRLWWGSIGRTTL